MLVFANEQRLLPFSAPGSAILSALSGVYESSVRAVFRVFNSCTRMSR